ncbi:MAG: MarR family transcriptional regulator, partial [Thermodesulfobacteriota bacterium]|nr:MarR family transcriptional regulator [Thermodesulfobacteriota bacterium]
PPLPIKDQEESYQFKDVEILVADFLEEIEKVRSQHEKQIKIGVGDAATMAKGFINVWRRAERGEKIDTDRRLNFENLEMLLKTLTPGRWVLLKKLRTNGPMSIRALADKLGRDYKNVHTDVRRLELIGLIGRTKNDKIDVPWDMVEARLMLAA